MTIDEAIKTLNEVIPPPTHATVDLEHLHIAQAWVVIKEELQKTEFLRKEFHIKENEE